MQLAFFAGEMAGWAYWVVVVLYAYAHGGGVMVGVVGALRLFGAALIGPFAGAAADRYPRRLVLVEGSSQREIWTTATTVGQALEELGMQALPSQMSISPETPIPLAGISLELRVPHNVTLTDGAGAKTPIGRSAFPATPPGNADLLIGARARANRYSGPGVRVPDAALV